MGLFKKKVDPISDRTRALNAEISALEARIKKLNGQVQSSQGPRLRSTVYPSGLVVPGHPPPAAPPARTEPIFEEVHQKQLTQAPEPATNPQHFNEMGVRKYDFLAAWERLKSHFVSRPRANPKLINYLAAGSIQGLRPLRIEKSIARRRFLLVTATLAGLVLWIVCYLARRG